MLAGAGGGRHAGGGGAAAVADPVEGALAAIQATLHVSHRGAGRQQMISAVHTFLKRLLLPAVAAVDKGITGALPGPEDFPLGFATGGASRAHARVCAAWRVCG